jgi:hypothetical protein
LFSAIAGCDRDCSALVEVTITLIAGQDAIEARGETALGIVVDRTERGEVVLIEILDVSERLPLPLLLESIWV